MPRSHRLVAASFWLLLLSGCGDESPARSPAASRPPRSMEASHVALGKPSRAQQPLRPSLETSASHSRANERSGGLSHEPLAERFANVRALAVQRGSASYYSDSLAGRPTASGAPYEPRRFTAAHRSLPFGTVLRVTRLDGGKVVYVRVTDRGPFGPRGRIVDLSRAAAEQLGMLRAGVVKIKAEVLEYGPRKPRRRRR